MSYPWFRYYSETIGDRKFKRIARQAGTSRAVVLGVHGMILCLANDSPERGVLRHADGMPITHDDITEAALDFLDLDPELFARILAGFENNNIVAWKGSVCRVSNWEKRQSRSDYSTPRTRAYRERQRGTTQGTFPKRQGTQGESESESEEESESDREVEVEGEAAAGDAAADGDDNPIYISEEWIPEIYQHPDIQMIEQITGKLPSEKEITRVLQTIQMIRLRYELFDSALISYLTRFWTAWVNSTNKNGKPYNPLNYAWLYEWALNNHIPDYGKELSTAEKAEKDRRRYADWEKRDPMREGR